MTDEQIIDAVKQCRAARELFEQMQAAEDKAREELSAAEERTVAAQAAYRRATQAVYASWTTTPSATAAPAMPTTPEPTGTNAPKLDIHDVLASGVIPGAPDVEPIHRQPPVGT